MPQTSAEATFDRTLPVTGQVTLDIDLDSGVVVILGGESGALRVRGVLRARRSFLSWGSIEDRLHWLEQHPPIRQNGNHLQIGYTGGDSMLRGITLLLEITVPAETQVRARTDSGDIRVREIKGPVACEADSGEIEIAQIHSGVRASADSGSIRIAEVNGAVYAEADSGSIQAMDIHGAIEAKTDSGSIRLSQAEAAPIRARADSGSIDVRLAPEGGYNLRAKNDGGSVNAPEMTFVRTLSRNEVEGQVRGGGPLVDLENDSGTIDIR